MWQLNQLGALRRTMTTKERVCGCRDAGCADGEDPATRLVRDKDELPLVSPPDLTSSSVWGVQLRHRGTHVPGARRHGIAVTTARERIGRSIKTGVNKELGAGNAARKASTCGAATATEWRTAVQNAGNTTKPHMPAPAMDDGRQR